MSTAQHQQFLNALKQEALVQQQLSRSQLLPPSLRPLAALIATHTWQSLLVASLVLALIITKLGVELHIV